MQGSSIPYVIASPFPQVELFATRVIARLPCYVSVCEDSEAIQVDALAHTFNWNRFSSIYAFPPTILLPDIISRVVGYRGTMMLIAPLDLSAVWFSTERTTGIGSQLRSPSSSLWVGR